MWLEDRWHVGDASPFCTRSDCSGRGQPTETISSGTTATTAASSCPTAGSTAGVNTVMREFLGQTRGGAIMGWPPTTIFWNNKNKCVFNLTIKVCNSCSWQYPGTFALSTLQLTLSLYFCSSVSKAQCQFEGLWRVLSQLKKPFKSLRRRWSCCEERKRKIVP